MSEIQTNNVQYVMLIADQKKKKKFLSLLSDYDARGIEIVYGHGSMSPSALAAAFGFEAEQGKVLISCLMKADNARALMEVLYKDYNFDRANTGIAFSITVEGLTY